MGEVNPQALSALGGLAILGKVKYGITADDVIPHVSCKSDHLRTKYGYSVRTEYSPTLFHEPLKDEAERLTEGLSPLLLRLKSALIIYIYM